MPSPLWSLVFILIVLWAAGLFTFHVGSLINLILVAVVIIVLYKLFVGGRGVGGPPIV